MSARVSVVASTSASVSRYAVVDVSTSFGCRVNVGVLSLSSVYDVSLFCVLSGVVVSTLFCPPQGASSPDPSQVYVDMRALRNDRVTLVEKGSPHSLCVMESGKLLPGVKVVIANPETRGQCADSHLGEVCVCSQGSSKVLLQDSACAVQEVRSRCAPTLKSGLTTLSCNLFYDIKIVIKYIT